MQKILGYIFTPIFYLYFGFFCYLFQPIQWLCYNVGGYNPHRIAVNMLNFFLNPALRIMGYSLSVRGRANVPDGKPIIFVANHQSMYDIPTLIWHLRRYHMKFIAKKELGLGLASITYNLRKGGSALIDRSDPRQSITEIARLGAKLEKNCHSVLLFPEGTRAKDGIMKPFKSGGLKTLIQNMPSAVVVPIAIRGSWKVMQHSGFPIPFGGQIVWQILPAIDPKNFKTVDELMHYTEQQVKQKINY